MWNLTLKESEYVLRALVAHGKIRLTQVRQTLNNRQKEIQELKRRLKALEGFGGHRRESGKVRTPPKRRRRLSPRVRALRRLQGRYMGFVRRLTGAQKARVKAIREKQGLPAAIRLASSLARKA
jgi:hypothetical protein